MLYIVSTPIGNLKDITYRAVETLRKVDLIAAEDIRHTKILTDHYQIKTPITSYFEHSKPQKLDYLISLLKAGKQIALVTDAGTPGISDPGFPLIRAAIANHIPMTVVPGPSALITALSLSGLPSDSFVFAGFLPPKSAARRRKLAEFGNERRTIIFYESPHRLLKTLQDIRDVLNDPLVVCARELTKRFEEIKSGLSHELVEHFSKVAPRGEFVVLLELTNLRS